MGATGSLTNLPCREGKSQKKGGYGIPRYNMKMALHFAVALVSFVVLSTGTSKGEDYFATHILSSATATNGVALGIASGPDTNTIDSRMVVTFQKVAGKAIKMYEPKPQCLGKLTLYDVNNGPGDR